MSQANGFWYTTLRCWWYILVSEKWYKIRAHLEDNCTRTIITKFVNYGICWDRLYIVQCTSVHTLNMLIPNVDDVSWYVLYLMIHPDMFETHVPMRFTSWRLSYSSATAAASGTKNGNFIIGLRLNCRFSLWSRNNSETILDWGNTIIIMRSAICVCLSYISN